MAKSQKSQTSRSITVHLEPDLAMMLDQAMVNFGLDSRSAMVNVMMRGWLSAVMENTTIFEICQQSVKEIRKAEFEALALFFASRADMYGAGRR